MKAAWLGLATLLAGAVPASAADLAYQIINGGDLTIMEVYASPTGQDRWGEDLLYTGVLPPGKEVHLLIPDARSQCDYDLRFVFENGRELAQTARVCDARGYMVRGVP